MHANNFRHLYNTGGHIRKSIVTFSTPPPFQFQFSPLSISVNFQMPMPSHSSYQTAQAGCCPSISLLILLSQKEWEELSLKVPKYKALVNMKRLRPWESTQGYLSSPLCLIDFHGQMDGFSPLSGVYCILCQLKGMSQHLLLYFPSTSTAALYNFVDFF